MVEAALIGSIHKDFDNASLWGQSDGDAALKGLMGPVSSVEAGPFLIEVEASSLRRKGATGIVQGRTATA